MKKAIHLQKLTLIFSICVCAVSSADESLDELQGRLRKALAAGQHQESVVILDKLIKAQPDESGLYYLRGRQNFRAGDAKASVADFDEYVKRSPRRESSQWERGISMYYAEAYARGAKQFELYQTYQNTDVENSVWRYLCVAKSQGVKAAEANMLPIEGDRRVPMMEIYDLYRGVKRPAEVLRAVVETGEPSAEELAGRWFYTDLYLGLYYEVHNQPALARYHLELAATPSLEDNSFVNSYMWDVARIHWQQMQSRKVTGAGGQQLLTEQAYTQLWVNRGKPAGWKFANGVLRSEAGNSGNWLQLKQEHENFVLAVEWKVSAGGNSGVFIRSTPDGAPWLTGYEIQISNAPRDDSHCTGSLYGYAAVRPRPDETADKWHRFLIAAQGPLIRVSCDGVTCVLFDQTKKEATAKKPVRGHIGLQDAHAAKGNYVEYRNAALWPLP